MAAVCDVHHELTVGDCPCRLKLLCARTRLPHVWVVGSVVSPVREVRPGGHAAHRYLSVLSFGIASRKSDTPWDEKKVERSEEDRPIAMECER